MPLRHPDRTAGVIGLNTPFIPRLSRDPIALYRENLGEDMYIVYFQKPGEAEAVFEADLEKTFRFNLRRPNAAMAKEAREPIYKAIPNYVPSAADSPILTDEELGVYVEMYLHSGFRGGINWYRNFTRNWENSAHLVDRVDVPSLMVMAEKDAVLPPSMTDRMGKYCSDLEKALILDCGHWTQQEKPEEVNRIFLDWLNRRFPR
jgi:pimeloyl-ACP methyl ester carboxylesterase